MPVEAETHAVAELRVVLEQRVRPRGAETLGIARSRGGRQIPAEDGRATRGIRDHHPIAEQLRRELQIRRLAAARAGAGEFEQRLEELRALDGGRLRLRPVALRQAEEEGEVLALLPHERRLRRHAQRLLARAPALRGADLHAQIAPGAVLWGDLDRVLQPLVLGPTVVDGLERGWCARKQPRLERLHPQRGVRTDEHALVACLLY